MTDISKTAKNRLKS